MRRLAIQALHESTDRPEFAEAPAELVDWYRYWADDPDVKVRVGAHFVLEFALRRLPRAKYLFDRHILTYWDGGLRHAPRWSDYPRKTEIPHGQ